MRSSIARGGLPCVGGALFLVFLLRGKTRTGFPRTAFGGSGVSAAATGRRGLAGSVPLGGVNEAAADALRADGGAAGEPADAARARSPPENTPGRPPGDGASAQGVPVPVVAGDEDAAPGHGAGTEGRSAVELSVASNFAKRAQAVRAAMGKKLADAPGAIVSAIRHKRSISTHLCLSTGPK